MIEKSENRLGLEKFKKPLPRLRLKSPRLVLAAILALAGTGVMTQNFSNPKNSEGAPLASPDINWGLGSNMVCVKSAMASATTPEGVFVMGGTGAEGPNCQDNVIYSNTTYKRDLLGNWTEKSNMPIRVTHADAEYINGKIYVTGGEGVDGFSTNAIKKFQIYDISNNSWSLGPDLPKERQGHQAVAVNNKLVIIGGFDKNGVTLKSVDIFDTDTMTYSAGPEMFNARSNFGAALNTNTNEINVFLGNSGDGSNPLLKSEKLNPSLTSWSQLPTNPAPKSRLNHQTVYHAGKNVFLNIAGINIASSEAFKDVEEFNPTTNSYSVNNDINTRRELLAAHYTNGEVIVIGGVTNTSPNTLKSTEIGRLAGTETATPTKTATIPVGVSTPTPTKTPEKPIPTNTPTPTPTEPRPVVKPNNYDIVIPVSADNSDKITQP